MPSMQSAYCKRHCTETALLRVKNAALRTVDCRQDAVLVMLDLPAAFDTLDHTILLDRLSRYFCFSHTVLRWFSSYLTGWIQSVTIGNTISSNSEIRIWSSTRFDTWSSVYSLHSTYSRHNLCS